MYTTTFLTAMALMASTTLALPQGSKSPSCARIVQSGNLALKGIDAFSGNELFLGVPVNSEADCVPAINLLNGVAEENGIANVSPFPLQVSNSRRQVARSFQSPSCARDVQSGNLALKGAGAFSGNDLFTGVAVNSEADCISALSLLNSVAEENGIANVSPFPLQVSNSKRQATPSRSSGLSCSKLVNIANSRLQGVRAFNLDGSLFQQPIEPASEADCQSVMTQLNDLAAENGIATGGDPFPLPAPFTNN